MRPLVLDENKDLENDSEMKLNKFFSLEKSICPIL